MGFLSGPITFQSFRLDGSQPRQFGPEQIEVLERFAIGQTGSSSAEEAEVGFLAGAHLFDLDFSLEKNCFGDAIHCAMRIDANQVPAAVRKAWMQMELAAAMADNPGGRPTKAQRQEAKEAVEARCDEEARTGKFRRMQQFPVLWDARTRTLCFGGASGTAGEQCCELFSRAFDLELLQLSAGRRAQNWASAAKKRKALEEVVPSGFHPGNASAEVAWWNHEADNFDFLGNEFLLWLWWRLETQSDTIALADSSEVTGMLARTLSLQCPRDESGKETITAEAPALLPEAAQAIRSGKLPRRAGLILVRHGQEYELVLQAETFTVSGARIRTEESEEPKQARVVHEDRIESLRGLIETVDLLYGAFCERRIGKSWPGELQQIRRWLKKESSRTR